MRVIVFRVFWDINVFYDLFVRSILLVGYLFIYGFFFKDWIKMLSFILFFGY